MQSRISTFSAFWEMDFNYDFTSIANFSRSAILLSREEIAFFSSSFASIASFSKGRILPAISMRSVMS
jgi:hypothetical protein